MITPILYNGVTPCHLGRTLTHVIIIDPRMEEYSIMLTSFSYEGDSERLSDWLKGTELYVALCSRKILASMHLFKALFYVTRLDFIAAKLPGLMPRWSHCQYANCSSSEGPKHKYRATEPPTAATRVQPSMSALAHPQAGPRAAAPACLLESSWWLRTSAQEPTPMVQPGCETPPPLPSLFSPLRGW